MRLVLEDALEGVQHHAGQPGELEGDALEGLGRVGPDVGVDILEGGQQAVEQLVDVGEDVVVVVDEQGQAGHHLGGADLGGDVGGGPQAVGDDGQHQRQGRAVDEVLEPRLQQEVEGLVVVVEGVRQRLDDHLAVLDDLGVADGGHDEAQRGDGGVLDVGVGVVDHGGQLRHDQGQAGRQLLGAEVGHEAQGVQAVQLGAPVLVVAAPDEHRDDELDAVLGDLLHDALDDAVGLAPHVLLDVAHQAGEHLEDALQERLQHLAEGVPQRADHEHAVVALAQLEVLEVLLLGGRQHLADAVEHQHAHQVLDAQALEDAGAEEAPGVDLVLVPQLADAGHDRLDHPARVVQEGGEALQVLGEPELEVHRTDLQQGAYPLVQSGEPLLHGLAQLDRLPDEDHRRDQRGPAGQPGLGQPHDAGDGAGVQAHGGQADGGHLRQVLVQAQGLDFC